MAHIKMFQYRAEFSDGDVLLVKAKDQKEAGLWVVAICAITGKIPLCFLGVIPPTIIAFAIWCLLESRDNFRADREARKAIRRRVR